MTTPLYTVFYCAAIIFAALLYIFIAGITFVSTRMDFFSSVDWDKDYTYAECESRQEAGLPEHIIAFIWPVVWGFAILFFIAFFIKKGYANIKEFYLRVFSK